jgi:hypothetical protein
MTTRTVEWHWDRFVSVARKCLAHLSRGGDYKSVRVDLPDDVSEVLLAHAWTTAEKAHAACMPAEKAFPFAVDVSRSRLEHAPVFPEEPSAPLAAQPAHT